MVGIENQDRQTLNSPGFAHGLSTAGRLPALEARWRPAVGNPAPCSLDHKTKDNIPFRSPIQRAAFPAWKLNGLPISENSSSLNLGLADWPLSGNRYFGFGSGREIPLSEFIAVKPPLEFRFP